MLSLILAAAVAAPAALPPAGKYWYAETVRGKVVNVAAVELARSDSKIALNEEIKPESQADPMAPFIQTRANVDPATLDLSAFHEAAAIGCGELEYTMAPGAGGVRVGKKAIDLPGVAHYAVDDSQAIPFLLPSQMQYWHDPRIGIVDPVKGIGRAVSADPVTEVPARPASVPAGDRYLSVRPETPGSPALGIWYDPATMIVDELSSGNAVWTRLAKPPSDAESF